MCQDIFCNFMRIVVQRVREARVEVAGQVTGHISAGLLVFLAVAKTDSAKDADYLAHKLIGLRIFPDSAGKMNRNVMEAGGGLLIVSNFTLYGDCRKGKRPSFELAAGPEQAQALYDHFVTALRAHPVIVATGVFQASMTVSLVNDGPVTIICESAVL